MYYYRIAERNRSVIEKVYEFAQENIFVTPIVIAEFYRGARDKEEFLKCRKLIEKLIAATALHYNLPLYTLNKRDFQFISGIWLL